MRTRNAVAVLTTATIAACTPQPAPGTDQPITATSSGYQVPATIHYSDHWVQTPAVDLMGSDGTFIRAYSEAETVRLFNANKSAGSYPGFKKADHTTNHAGGSIGNVYGYSTSWILNFSESPDNTVTALLCIYQSINPSNEDSPTLSPLTLRYTRNGNSPPTNQHGPARAPSVSVFGDWYATFFGYETPGQPDLAPCKNSQPPIDKGPVSTPGWPGPEAA